MVRISLFLIFLQLPFLNNDLSFKKADYKNVDDFSVVKKSFNKNYNNYQLNITYPEIRTPQNEKHYEWNLQVQGVMTSAISDFQKQIHNVNTKNSFSYLNLDYSICNNYGNIMGIRFMKRVFCPGMPKVHELYRTINYNVATKEFIQLEDLFDSAVNAREVLINIINSKYSNCQLDKNTRLGSFCIEEENLLIILDEYTLPDEFCATEIKIYWEELTPYLK